jgi:hypothetical protein
MRKLVITQNMTLDGSIEMRVVDEYRLFVYPAVQGRGRRLFPDRTAIGRLTLLEPPKSFRSGITLLRYAA